MDGVECAFFGVQGKAHRRGMARPRRAEQCLPEEGATPQREAGATNELGSSFAASPALPDPCFAGPRVQRFEVPHSKELQRSHVPQKLHNPPRSELTKKVNAM
ncbi:hypothetical protein SAMN05216332_10447 [Nitrosospira briensis]|nr:hypothetical protein SAMN05216332_10447 [Nitrosospira briensis]